MRHYCILKELKQVYGLVTNFKQWVFTSYNLLKEANLEKTKYGYEIPASAFEVSHTIEILDDNLLIIPEELEKIVYILRWLTKEINCV